MRLTGGLERGRLRDRTELQTGKIEAMQRRIGDLKVSQMKDDPAECCRRKIPAKGEKFSLV